LKKTSPNHNPRTVSLISLGCVKNTVLAEKIASLFSDNGFQVIPESPQTDLFVINTCGFLQIAREEGLSVIQDLLNTYSIDPQQIILLGCYAYRFPKDILQHYPSITLLPHQDPIQGVEEYLSVQNTPSHRLLSTSHYAYLRIAQGCNRHCSYCLIPSIKGAYKSFPQSSLLEECRYLADHFPIQELILIAQDTSRYGLELYPKSNLQSLVHSISQLELFPWIRILYMYPNQFSYTELRDLLSIPSVIPYVDMPLQHYHPDILKRMNRPIDSFSYMEQIYALREDFPHMTFRSTFIVGYPGETEEHFSFLCGKLKELPLDRVGFFAYSNEKEVSSYQFKDQIPDSIKQSRLKEVYSFQESISLQLDSLHISQSLPILLERYEPLKRCAIGRSIREAPDVDTSIMVYGNPFRLRNQIGSIVKCTLAQVTANEMKAQLQ
jgi:ribosomal protein S12 methylthiotransferase